MGRNGAALRRAQTDDVPPLVVAADIALQQSDAPLDKVVLDIAETAANFCVLTLMRWAGSDDHG